MKRNWAMKWAKALESGRYKQTKLVLHDSNGYCCLGVLCRLAGKRFKYDHTEGLYLTIERSGTFLPKKVQKLVGMKSENGLNSGHSLSMLNDESMLSFKEIAQVIRKKYKEL